MTRLPTWIPRPTLRIALSYYVSNGMSAALGMLLISGGIHLFFGAFAAAAASVGVMVVIPPDQAAPRRGKFWHLLPAPLIGLPLFFTVQTLHASPILLGMVLIPATFLAFLAAAWGKRGLPISISVMFAMVFSMAVPPDSGATASSLYFALGAALYLIYATLANALLNRRYRVQILADTMLSLADLMRLQAQQFSPGPAEPNTSPAPLLGRLMRQQAALAEQLQLARNILLESPRTVHRQRLAGILMQILETRDHLLACGLDLDILSGDARHAGSLAALREILESLAGKIETIADDLLLGQLPEPMDSLRDRLAQLPWSDDDAVPPAAATPSAAMLARGLASRVGHINDETLRILALARGEADPDLAVVRAAWRMFVSPTAWSWLPWSELFGHDAPPTRHALRAALAIGTAYAISLALPWGTHDYWILLTIVVVLRGSFAQTVDRRNSRVLGTLAGCILAALLLSLPLPHIALLLAVTLAQGVAHGFAVKRYLFAAVGATVLGLVQAHLLSTGSSSLFNIIERMADTLLGVGIAWAFSYVLPSWERTRIPSLVARTLAAQSRHVTVALGLGQFAAVDDEPELAWRLARKEVYDSLSALVQATQQSLVEPRAVRPPLEPLERMLAHSYQLLGQLTAVKTMLLLRRGRLDLLQLSEPLRQTAERIATELTRPGDRAPASQQQTFPAEPQPLENPFDSDLSPWALRRLALADATARRLRYDADEVLSQLNARTDKPRL